MLGKTCYGCTAASLVQTLDGLNLLTQSVNLKCSQGSCLSECRKLTTACVLSDRRKVSDDSWLYKVTLCFSAHICTYVVWCSPIKRHCERIRHCGNGEHHRRIRFKPWAEGLKPQHGFLLLMIAFERLTHELFQCQPIHNRTGMNRRHGGCVTLCAQMIRIVHARNELTSFVQGTLSKPPPTELL